MQELNTLSPKIVKQILEAMGAQDIEEAQDALEAEDWALMTYEEAQKATREEVARSLWAFNSNFLAECTGLDASIFDAIADNGKCEDNNEAVWALIKGTCGLDHVVEEAISWDGRGNFLAYYDHCEHEILGESADESLYLYRRN